MSRRITEKASVTISQEENKLLHTASGKVIFTECRQQKCAFLIKDNRLTAISVQNTAESKIGAVYLGKVKNVIKNIDACFVEIADQEVCFLPLKDVSVPFLLNRKFDGRLLAGDELLVQVKRDAQKTKQASVTSRISISNDFFALEIGSDRINYSAKLDTEARKNLWDMLFQSGIQDENKRLNQMFFQPVFDTSVTIPIGMIVRTKAGEFDSTDVLRESFDSLTDELNALLLSAAHCSCFSCLRDPQNAAEQMLEQLAAGSEFDEVITDEETCYQQLLSYAAGHTPSIPIRLYEDTSFPLKSLYGLEAKLDDALRERVWLKSGGYLVIQPTEALTVIDVNSGKYDGKTDADESARKVNLEAAAEVALQLRLRNLSGIIIVDFINMKQESFRDDVMDALRRAVRKDRVQTRVIDMTPLGLVELTRKKINKPLHEQNICRQS
jgi:ribonuclease G